MTTLTGLRAQEIVVAPPPEALMPEAQKQVYDAENPTVSQAVPLYPNETPLFISGPLTFRAHLLYRFVEADGLPDPDGTTHSTGIHNLTPDMFMDVGRHWVLNYTPTFVFYTNSAYNNSVDQSLRLDGWATYEDWTFSANNSFLSTSSPDVQLGQQARQTTWSNNVSGVYSINSALALELGLSHAYQSAEDFSSSHEYSTADWLHYKAAPRLDTAIGLAYGYLDMSAGTDSTYLRPQVRMTWSALNKLSFSAHAGEESRHFRDGSAANANNPLYGASLQWSPIGTTRISLGADHLVSTTYFPGVLMKTTQWNAQLEQQLVQHLFLNASISQQKNDYVVPAGSLVSVRNDDTYSYAVQVSTDVFGRVSAAVFFQDTHNSSDLAQFGVASRQYGLELGYRF
ncbi:MAG TPA: outer membrane beta-barrel protein [Candidatus Didemnitutus sp.]|nr:outer membrane beta-barrel protein [Candidatus Didemnitutus sp.]